MEMQIKYCSMSSHQVVKLQQKFPLPYSAMQCVAAAGAAGLRVRQAPANLAANFLSRFWLQNMETK